MNDNIKSLLALCFISVSCTLGKVQQKAAPLWIRDTSAVCTSDSLCALGEGSGLLEAEHSARESLAKIFETRIQGSTESLSSREHALYQKESIQTFDETLQGIRIIRRHRKQNTFYALASLHKKTSAQSILQKAKSMDELLLQYYRKGDPQAFLTTLKLRQALQDRHLLLTGKPIPQKIRYGEMRNKMAAIRTFRTHKKILVEAKISELKRLLVENLTAQSYRTTEQQSHAYDIKLNAHMNSRRLHFKVPGFKKYEFSLQIKIYNSQGIQKDMLSLKRVQTGRSESQAWELASKNIFTGLEKKIDSLLEE